MTDNVSDSESARPCPTCAALVREADMAEHQKWHARRPEDVTETGIGTRTDEHENPEA